MATTASRPGISTRIGNYLPIVRWMSHYDKAKLRPDIIAAVTVASFSVPESMAYAGLAGLPPEAGLYAGMAAPIAYAIFGTSRQLGVGATSALSILVASGVAGLAAGDADRYAALAAMLALLVGGICLVAWLLRLGFLVNFISESVLTGFSAGAALYIGSTQLGKLFGIEGASGEFFERIGYILRHLDETNGATLIVGISGIVLLLIGERAAPRLPWSLIVVMLAIAVMSFSNLEDRGVSVTGDIPSGLPAPAIPDVGLADLRALAPVALAVFLLAYVEGMGAVQSFAKEHGYRADANQELLALGASNAATGLFQSFPVGGSLSRSAVNNEAGATTPLASLGTGVLVGAVALFLTGLFAELPEAVLGAVVIVAVRGLFKVSALRRLYAMSPVEFSIAMVALAGVLLFGMLQGVLLGAAISILLVIWRVSRPVTAMLGRVPGTNRFSDVARH
ncbi:MAG TPA: SulP family inorganic anion transporter, partial [Thermomicrobiales bacterium]|nr:SulP family inorganic anion transporter [Thermomicrobiales bacterium]